MERIDFVNPKRIEWCCEDLGISLDELAIDSGVNIIAINKAFRGEPSLTYNQLSKIASYFGRDALFFLEDGAPESEKVHSAQYRTLTNQKPEISINVRRMLEQTELQRDRYIGILEEIGELSSLNFDPPLFKPDTTINEYAGLVRDWLQLPNTNNFTSYRKAVEQKGILVFQSNGYKGKWQIPKESSILGFSIYSTECPVIVIKKRPWPAQQVFTLMHELGHILLHKESSIDDIADLDSRQGMEQEANKFAGLLLLPDHLLSSVNLELAPEEVSEYPKWLKPLRTQLGISTEVILRRLVDSNMLSNQRYQKYREWFSDLKVEASEGGNRAYRHREPHHIFGDRFVRAVFDAKNAQRLTLTRVSKYLDNLKVKDLHQLEQFIASN